MLLENRNRKGHTASVLVICPLTSIINDQIFELESMGLCACCLSQKLADLKEVEGGKYHKKVSRSLGSFSINDGNGNDNATN